MRGFKYSGTIFYIPHFVKTAMMTSTTNSSMPLFCPFVKLK